MPKCGWDRSLDFAPPLCCSCVRPHQLVFACCHANQPGPCGKKETELREGVPVFHSLGHCGVGGVGGGATGKDYHNYSGGVLQHAFCLAGKSALNDCVLMGYNVGFSGCSVTDLFGFIFFGCLKGSQQLSNSGYHKFPQMYS